MYSNKLSWIFPGIATEFYAHFFNLSFLIDFRSSDGRLLVACSMDGTVVGCMFEESEFGGARVSQDEKAKKPVIY